MLAATKQTIDYDKVNEVLKAWSYQSTNNLLLKTNAHGKGLEFKCRFKHFINSYSFLSNGLKNTYILKKWHVIEVFRKKKSF